jgi:hypothetical protein
MERVNEISVRHEDNSHGNGKRKKKVFHFGMTKEKQK